MYSQASPGYIWIFLEYMTNHHFKCVGLAWLIVWLKIIHEVCNYITKSDKMNQFYNYGNTSQHNMGPLTLKLSLKLVPTKCQRHGTVYRDW